MGDTKKILCLHGFGQTAELLPKRGNKLFKKLSRTYQLYYPEAPYDITLTKPNGDQQFGKGWFYYDRDDPDNYAPYLDKDYAEWIGLDKSIQRLLQYNEEYGPFDAILGFSQGAQMAYLMSQILNPKCMIIVSGFLTPKRLNIEDRCAPSPLGLGVPSLHIMGTQDNFIT